MPLAVLTFDEPEFEPSYAGTANEGKSVFAWLFFTGRCRLSHVSLKVLRSDGLLRGAAYLMAAVYFSARSLFWRSETVFDLLARLRAPATFFGVFSLIDAPGSRETYLPIFRAILEHGHELGLHGYRHGPLSEGDLERSRALAREQLGVALNTYSSPFGDDRLETLKLIEREGFLGMRVWDADLLAYDSSVRRFPYDYQLERAAESQSPVVVLNLHSGDCYPWGFRRVKRALTRLKKRGYRFITFAELCATTPADIAAAAA